MRNQEVPAENLPVVPAERQAAKNLSDETGNQREDKRGKERGGPKGPTDDGETREWEVSYSSGWPALYF